MLFRSQGFTAPVNSGLRAWIAAEVARDREAFVAKHPDMELARVAIG